MPLNARDESRSIPKVLTQHQPATSTSHQRPARATSIQLAVAESLVPSPEPSFPMRLGQLARYPAVERRIVALLLRLE
jgi:hypothetical protein